MQDRISRRSTLKLLVAVPLGAAVVSACGKKTEPDSCQDVSALGEPEKAARSALQYTDKSPEKDRHCANCTYWQAPKDVAQCGGCTLVKGPIHPNGYCTAFAAKQA